MLGIVDEDVRQTNRKRKKKDVSFSEDDEIINPGESIWIGNEVTYMVFIYHPQFPSKKKRV